MNKRQENNNVSKWISRICKLKKQNIWDEKIIPIESQTTMLEKLIDYGRKNY